MLFKVEKKNPEHNMQVKLNTLFLFMDILNTELVALHCVGHAIIIQVKYIENCGYSMTKCVKVTELL